ncbi:class F sortase [Indiicoccus explosivorum]|uniref:class F sortase n=1 Tax=Indiicoccus explosivorum TaxID=1917864 RepID=UPI001F4E2619|nr:class F sortase [Indiicoccus explosivorum]
MAGCQEGADEVSERTEEIGFTAEVPAAEPLLKAQSAENPINGLTRPGIEPLVLRIPAIGVEADVLHLGTTESGAMAVPGNIADVSWFAPGYRPGQNGRAVIAGHVDGPNGPAVFWDLPELKAGDEIIVEGADKNLVFRVEAMESTALDDIDVKAVFGYRSSPELVLITCSGSYSESLGTREERLIVYAGFSEEVSKAE